jgi:RimJ/RimL family protein N-acetyltransferase
VETLNDRDLMELKANALFTHDAAGRILTSNESDPERAPRLFLGRTPDGNVWRFRDDLSDNVAANLERLCREEPPLANPRQRPVLFDALKAVLEAREPVVDVWEGPAWYVPRPLSEIDGAVAIGSENRDLLEEHFPYAAEHLDEQWHVFAVVVDGVAVSTCYSSRLTPAAAEAGAFTVEDYRGRGYVGWAVAAWGNTLLASGRVPIYSTSWDNAASQGVARKLGLPLFGAELSLR